MKALPILGLYFRIKDNPGRNFMPCVMFFGEKAAPGVPSGEKDYQAD